METEVSSIEAPIHVSFKTVKNTVPGNRYMMEFAGYKFITSSEKGTPGVQITLYFNKSRYPDYEKKAVFDRFWFTEGSMNFYLSFIVACGISSEMMREEPIDPPQFDQEGKPITRCVYSVEDQLKSILASSVWVDVIEESYQGVAADSITPETKWVNRVQPRGYSKVWG